MIDSRPSLLFGLVLLLSLSCGEPEKLTAPEESTPPNILLVVWDTVRADRMSLYGHEAQTTPYVDSWAKEARVYDNCLSPGSTTIPAHASIFTGLLPGEHGASNRFMHLDDRHRTLAETFQAGGYGTYLYSANPFISASANFNQGFDRSEHPWSPGFVAEAMQIMRTKLDPRDRTSHLTDLLSGGDLRKQVKRTAKGKWGIKASGGLAEKGLLTWLENQPEQPPFFAVLNYMEAHAPLIPALEYRQQLMTPEQVEQSYIVDRSWDRVWGYVFGLDSFTPEELALTRLTYDAALRELDDLFKNLLGGLAEAGYLDNTVVVLVSDHGEHLGDHNLLDHQFSLYESLLRVPLVLWGPGRVDPGRVSDPVSSFDLFPTLLDLAGLEPPSTLKSSARHLLSPEPDRQRLAEYPAESEGPITSIQRLYPDWDPTQVRKSLRAFYQGNLKLILASNGFSELYDLAQDPGETSDLARQKPKLFKKMMRSLSAMMKNIRRYQRDPSFDPSMSEEQQERLRALGYVDGGE